MSPWSENFLSVSENTFENLVVGNAKTKTLPISMYSLVPSSNVLLCTFELDVEEKIISTVVIHRLNIDHSILQFE